MKRIVWWSFALWVLAAGCGPGEQPLDRCADVVCDRGRCDDASGECVNSARCLDDEQCIEGYICAEDACAAEFPCEADDDCDRGVCAQGACINPVVCESDESCVFGFKCVSGDCVSDRCSTIECEAGVCNPDTGACVNSVVCSQQNQAEQCIDGYFCYGQKCELADAICDEIDCARGVCDPSQARCVRAEDCAGSDLACLDGEYCDDDDTCQPNACDAEMTSCPRGECDPASGACVNPRNCGDPDDCLDGWSCVEGSCREAGDECAPDGCPGNQLCEYVPTDLVGICTENESGCGTTLDCVETRVCRGGTCRAGMACEPDALEPNDSDAQAVRVVEQPDAVIDATLCRGDVDVFAFHTDESPLFRGVLLVDLRIVAEDIGAGEVVVELVGPNGTTVSQSNAGTGVVRLSAPITVLNQGEHLVRVRAGDDLLPSGVRYSLFVDMLDEDAVDACGNAVLLDETPVSANSSSGASFVLGSSCTTDDNPAGEDVYQFELQETSFVEIEAVPGSEVQLTMALRERCEVPVDLYCENTSGFTTERIADVFAPGTYYLVVQGPGAGTGGPYTLTYDAAPVVCGPADSECTDQTTSRYCNANGTGFEEQVCDGDCDSDVGRCMRTEADVCYSATVATAGFSDSIDWDDFENDYDPGANGCVPDRSGTQTDGPDVAYEVTVPPNHVLIVDLDLASSDYGSLYVTNNCDDLANSCLAGANDALFGDERLIYFSQSQSDETLWVIADVEEDSFSYGTAGISIDIRPVNCTPGARRCQGDVREQCDALGTQWTGSLCSFGCSQGSCNALLNDSCSGAVDLGNGMPFTGRIDEYSTDENPGFSGCVGRSTSGPDALFEITPGAGQVATVSIDADFDAALYVATDCTDIASTCVAAADGTSIQDELLQFVGDGSTYTIVVDSQFNGSGLFTIDATIQSPSCTPGDVLGCADSVSLEYCSELGVPVEYGCSTACSNGRCDFPTGDVCIDAIQVTAPATYTSPFDAANDIDPGVGQSGNCNFTSSLRGADRVYEVDLQAGEWLFADLTASSSSTVMYVLGQCGDTSSCLANTTPSTSSNLVYEANGAETVYLVVDRTTSGTSTLTYEVDIEVLRQDCTPGATPFCVDSNTLSYCDGNGFTREYDCTGTCTGTACDTPTGDQCVDAIVATSGDSFTGDWSTGSNAIEPRSPIDGLCPWDSGLEPDGAEDIYRVDLIAGDLLRATLDTAQSSAVHYILEDCFDTSSCSASNFQGRSGTIYHYATFTGPAWVVVDSTSTFGSSTPYTLDIDVLPGASCAPEQRTCENGLMTKCNGAGTFETQATCASGCANAIGCTIPAAADKCATAPTVTGDLAVLYGSFADFTSESSTTNPSCSGGTGAGPDVFYAVDAGPGQVIHATLDSWASERVELSIVSDCSDVQNTCVSGSGTPDYDQVEAYFAPTTAGTYYVVADSSSSFNDEPFGLEIEVLSTQCVPGESLCAPTGQSLQICNQYGLWDDYPCDGGCTAGACGMPRGEACFDAISIADGGTYTSAYTGFDTFAPSGAVGACTFSSSVNGVERWFEIDLTEGAILEVELDSSSSLGILYLLGACGDESTCLTNTSSGTRAVLEYRAPRDETVYLAVDRTSAGTSTLTWDIDVTVLTPDCTPGSPATCADADTLSYCNELGFSVAYDCGGASPSCTNGACDTRTGGICLDALPAADGDQLTGDFTGGNELELSGTIGACTFRPSDGTTGSDDFFEIDMTAGQILIVDHVSSSASAITYLLSDCGDASSCLANTNAGGTGRLVYTAPQDDTVYLVVDRAASGTSSASWDVDITLATPNCTAGQRQCAPDGTTLEWCNSLGIFEDYACNGTCTAGACDMPTGDACLDPIVVTNGSVITDTYEGTNSIDLGGGMVGACNFTDGPQPGTDHVYRVDLTAGQVLNASYTTNSSFGVLSLVSDCTDASTCIANTDEAGSGAINYTATTNETLFLVMDRGLTGSTNSYDYTLTVSVQ